MKVLVTGGSGWIGRATCRQLENHGHEAASFDRTSGQDVLDQRSVREAVESADHVIHLAGLLGTHELLGNVRAAVDVNVVGSLNVTLACAYYGVGLTEITMPRVNPSVYAATKSAAMDLALALQASDDLRCSFVRAYNAYGPGQAYGGDHPQKIIPTFASKAWAGEPLPVWGDGMLWVDLVHVDDVARMLVAAMNYGDGEVFDAGTGYVQTVYDVALKVIHVVEQNGGGHCGGVKFLERRSGERLTSTDADVASGESWDKLGGWRPVFDPARFEEAVLSYRPVAVEPDRRSYRGLAGVLIRAEHERDAE